MSRVQWLPAVRPTVCARCDTALGADAAPYCARCWELHYSGSIALDESLDASREAPVGRGAPDATAGDDGRCVCGRWGCRGRCVPGMDRASRFA